MRITVENAPHSVEYDLTFLKPWKSQAKVKFETVGKDNSTEATWYMDSSLSFFLFWMKKSMEGFVGMDYERGLYLLKDLSESGTVHSKMSFIGKEKFDGCEYLGVQRLVSMDALDSSMQNDFNLLENFFKQQADLTITGNPFSIYNKWDVVNKKVGYISAFPVDKKPSSVPSEFVTGNIPSTEVNTIIHTGPYTHLGNAWSAQYSMKRNKEFKMNKKIHPFEIYENDPEKVKATDLKTRVCFPCK
jgi:effector-binding domain-containing protein